MIGETMRMPPNPEFLILETVFTLVALVLGLLIYFKTKESYELTKHPGIRYFRDAFLFLGLSYLLRFLFSAVFLSRIHDACIHNITRILQHNRIMVLNTWFDLETTERR
jgi:hypothetical protein